MKVPFPAYVPSAGSLSAVHLVGIGGAALSGIARLLLDQGVKVSGSDVCDSATVAALRALGARCHIGHDAANLGTVDAVVVSTAVREHNPEVVAARARGLPLWPRSAGMVSVMAGHTVVAVAGTHGKSTTTSMLAVALTSAGADPSYAIGADLAATGQNARTGSGALFVAEADESDGAFLHYRPAAAVVTNVDADHLDSYGTEEAYRRAFSAFLDRISPTGFLVACTDDPGAAALAGEASGRGLEVIGAGVAPEAEVRAVDIRPEPAGTAFTLIRGGEPLGAVRLQVPGLHYVLDATCALAAGLRLGFAFRELAGGIAAYRGSRRRMERLGEAAGVTVYDSYAHHPVEIAADLAAARQVAGGGRLVVCFQPHLVSRTRIFATEMGRALSSADAVVVTDVYVSREDPAPEVTGALVTAGVTLPAADVRFEPDLGALPRLLAALARPGDLVLTLGAGDITTVGPRLLQHLNLIAGGHRE